MGVIEFDTKTDTIVGNHNFVGSAPVYAPFSSPDGEYIILFGIDGGQTVEILKAGESGSKSQIAHTLSLDFNATNVEEEGVFNDFAYIQMNGMNCFVVSSASDYKVAIVDMDTLEVSYVMLKDVPFTGKKRNRQVEWAEGTSYVWIGGRQDDEAYVIDLETKELIQTFTDVDARKILSVAPHHFMGMADEYRAYFDEQDIRSSNGGGSFSNFMSSEGGGSTSDGADILSIVALALSCVAIAAVLASFFTKKADTPAGPSQAADGAMTTAATANKTDSPSIIPSVN